MSDRPWLEDGDPSLRVERELLKRLKAQQPPAGSAERGWAMLAAEISGGPALDPSGPSPIDPSHALPHALGGTAGSGIAAKIAVGLAIAGGSLWVGSELLSSDGAGSSYKPLASFSVPAEAPLEAQSEKAEAVAPETEGVPSAGTKQPAVHARPATSATTLAEEGRLLAKARQLIQSGQGQQALDVLRTSQTRYPRSALYQEREVLTIEALNATGASAAARQRAERFIKRHPSSPHAARLQRFVE